MPSESSKLVPKAVKTRTTIAADRSHPTFRNVACMPKVYRFPSLAGATLVKIDDIRKERLREDEETGQRYFEPQQEERLGKRWHAGPEAEEEQRLLVFEDAPLVA